MDVSSLIWATVWLVFLAAASAGGIAQTIAASVRLLSPLFYADQAARVNRLNLGGGVLSGLGLAGGGALAVYAVIQVSQPVTWAAFATAFSTLVIFSAREFARLYARTHLERLARPLLGDSVVLLPLVEQTTASPVVPSAGDETIEQMVDAGAKAGLIESDERQMISGVFRLDRTQARDIMVPRIDVVGVEVETPLRDALNVVVAGAHSRVPVYAETIDRVVGLLYAKDLLKTLRDAPEKVSLRDLIRPVRFIPESKRLDELLQELQTSKVHMAVVVDEYGGTAGILTIEDILEEIVGEIQDEYDTQEEPPVERVSDVEIVANGRATIDQVNELLALQLPVESDTIGGLVYGKLEKIPKAGDVLRIGNAEISVEGVTGRRVKKVRVRKIAPARKRKHGGKQKDAESG